MPSATAPGAMPASAPRSTRPMAPGGSSIDDRAPSSEGGRTRHASGRGPSPRFVHVTGGSPLNRQHRSGPISDGRRGRRRRDSSRTLGGELLVLWHAACLPGAARDRVARPPQLTDPLLGSVPFRATPLRRSARAPSVPSGSSGAVATPLEPPTSSFLLFRNPSTSTEGAANGRPLGLTPRRSDAVHPAPRGRSRPLLELTLSVSPRHPVARHSTSGGRPAIDQPTSRRGRQPGSIIATCGSF